MRVRGRKGSECKQHHANVKKEKKEKKRPLATLLFSPFITPTVDVKLQ